MVLGGSCERTAGGAAVDQLGYRPNRAARSLATQHTDMVALIVPEPDARLFSDLFFSVIVNAVNREFEDTHLQLVLMLADRGCEDTKLRPFLYEGHVDGAIVTSHHQVPHQIQTLLNAPMVFIGRPTQAPTFNSWVDVDNTESGRLGARRLIERGFSPSGNLHRTARHAGCSRQIEWLHRGDGEFQTASPGHRGWFHICLRRGMRSSHEP